MSLTASAAGLDIGSNTFSCAVLGVGPRGPVVLRDDSLPVRLSEGLVRGGALRASAVRRGLCALERLVLQLDLGAVPLRAVGTAVLRMTVDPAPFTGPAEEILGTGIEILDGATEARLAARGALLGLPGDGARLMIDIGGQSTELCPAAAGTQWEPLTLPLGVVPLTERFLAGDPPRPGEIAAARRWVREVLEREVPPGLPGTAVALAGTATALARLELGGGAFDRERIHGALLRRHRLGRWLERMLESTAAERVARHGIKAGRADVFPAGLVILDMLLDHLGCDEFTVSANGLRVGAALSIIEEVRG